MEQTIAIFVIVNFLIIGLSHLLQPKTWTEFFGLLHSQGNAGVFANGFITLIIGSIIVAFHNVWAGIPIVLTLLGWGFVAKSTIAFVFPAMGLRSLGKVETMPLVKFRIAGVVLIAIALLLTYAIFSGAYVQAA